MLTVKIGGYVFLRLTAAECAVIVEALTHYVTRPDRGPSDAAWVLHLLRDVPDGQKGEAMEIIKFEPGSVLVALSEADAALLAECLEPETVLEPGATDGRYEHVMATQAAFTAMAEALRMQARVIGTIMGRPKEAP